MNLAMVPIFAFRTHLSQSFPEFGDEIIVEEGNDDSTIEFHLKNGFSDNFKLFFHIGIKTKSVVSNCKTAKVKKLVFIDLTKNQFDQITIEKLETML